MCLGKGLAEVELAVVLTLLFEHFDIELAQAQVSPKRDGFFLAPSGGLGEVFRAREPGAGQ